MGEEVSVGRDRKSEKQQHDTDKTDWTDLLRSELNDGADNQFHFFAFYPFRP